MLRSWIAAVLGCLGLIWVAGCATAPSTVEERKALELEAEAAIRRFVGLDAGMDAKFFRTAKGYAVFPSVGKGAVGLGGAYGRGVLYEGGKVVGYCDLSQGSIGFQLGGQAYSEIIFFENDRKVADFKAGNFEFAAQASAVAIRADASANARYDDGVAVFTAAGEGLMFEASLGGQRFTYQPRM